MRARLDGCLLDERLAAADDASWAALPNPFPTSDGGEPAE